MVYSPLARTETVEVGDYRCAGADSASDELVERAELIFVRSGLFRIETSRGRELVDPSRVLLLEPGERYRVSHPGACHDRCLVLSFTPARLEELLGASLSLRGTRRPGIAHRCAAALFLAQERFRGALAGAGGDPLLADEGALALAAALLGGDCSGAEPPNAADRRVAAVQALLAERFAERLTLGELGAAVKLSPHRLARLFRAATGSSLHQHRLELRLRAAAARLADGERELTALALDLGFSDHAHFTNSFRRRFGIAPSAFRRSLASSQPARSSARNTPLSGNFRRAKRSTAAAPPGSPSAR